MSKWNAGVRSRLFRAHRFPLATSRPSPSQGSYRRYPPIKPRFFWCFIYTVLYGYMDYPLSNDINSTEL
ncbi:hypothetical protein DPMN_100103 [Dreissena polymorpha]|uniref:Uncharacterized protein n=1 Tax=Dreissena polymorpha TaxID=45954 RepID=A0A9D4LG80_DREPO|nr:hypothetical protein DPMN_100103 [Dreissena polymorpha]